MTLLHKGLDGLGLDLPPSDPGRPVTKSAFAASIGVSKSRVSQLVAQGLPVTPQGLIDPAEASEWIERNVDPNRRRGRTVPATGTLSSVKAETEAEKLKHLRLDYDRKAGNLVDRAAAESAIFARARMERDAHLSWVVRVAPTIAAELGLDADKVFRLLDREMRRHLEEVADTPLEVLG